MQLNRHSKSVIYKDRHNADKKTQQPIKTGTLWSNRPPHNPQTGTLQSNRHTTYKDRHTVVKLTKQPTRLGTL